MRGRARLLPLLFASCLLPAAADASGCEDAGWCTRSNAGTTLALDAALRLRGLYTDPLPFAVGGRADGYGLLRALGSADLRHGAWQAYAQLGAHGEDGRAGGPGGIDQGALDLQQAYVAWQGERLRLQLGRQEAAYGSSRLLSVRDGPNIRLAFDGARLVWRSGGSRVDLLALRPVDNRPGAFDDRTDNGQFLVGAYATWKTAATGIDAYLLGYGRAGARHAGVRGDEHRRSLGARLSGSTSHWDWNTELVLQHGTLQADSGAQRIRAWTVATDTGYQWRDARWSPRLGLRSNVASGDGDPGDGRLQTFNALYPRASYFSEASFLAPANLMDLQPTLTLQPHPRWSTTVGVQWAWKHRRADAIHVAPMPLAPLAGSAGTARRIGRQLKWETRWNASERWQWQLHLAHFDAGPGLRQAGGRDTFFASLLGAWSW